MNATTAPAARCHGNQTVVKATLMTSSLSLELLSTTLGSVALLLSVACLVFNGLLRNNRVIKMSSPRLNMVIASGGILASGCCILKGMDEYLVVHTVASNAICQVRQCLLVASFTLVYGPMVGKTWRVNQIFKLAGSKRVVIRDFKLLLFTSSLLLVDIGVLSLWFFLDPTVYRNVVFLEKMTQRGPEPQWLQNGDAFVFPECASQRSRLWHLTLVAVKLPVLLFGLREAWWTRGMILPHLNDSTALTVSALTTVAMATVHLAASAGTRDRPDVVCGTSVVCLWVSTVTAVVVVFVPKLLLWKRAPKGRLTHRVSISSACSSAAVLQSFEQMEAGLVSANAEIETLKEFIKEKEMNIEKLQTLLNDAEDNLAQLRFEHFSPGSEGLLEDQDKMCHNKNNLMNNHGKNNSNSNNNNNNRDVSTKTRCLPALPASALVVQLPQDHAPCGHCHDIMDGQRDLEHQRGCECQQRYYQHQQQHENDDHHHHNSHHSSPYHTRCFPGLAATAARRLSYDSRSNSNHSRRRCSCHSQEDSDTFIHDYGILDSIDSDSSVFYRVRHSPEVLFMETREHLPLSKTNEAKTGPGLNVKNNNEHVIKNDLSNSYFLGLSSGGAERDTLSDGNTIGTDADDRYARRRQFMRRRRSSTPSMSSVHSLDKLSRIRSDLNDALALSESLRSGWSTELARATRRARKTTRNYKRERRRSVLGIQHITDSIIASYDYRQSFDNQSYISDCLTSASSECSSDLHRSERGGRRVSNNLKKIWQKRRRSLDHSALPSFSSTFRAGKSRDSLPSDSKTNTMTTASDDFSDINYAYDRAVRRHSHDNRQFAADANEGVRTYNSGGSGMDFDLRGPSRSSNLKNGRCTLPQASTITSDSLYPMPGIKIRSDEMYGKPSTDGMSDNGPKASGERSPKTGILSNSSSQRADSNSKPYAMKATVTFADFATVKTSDDETGYHPSYSGLGMPRSQSDNELLSRSSNGDAKRKRFAGSSNSSCSPHERYHRSGQVRFDFNQSDSRDARAHFKGQSLTTQRLDRYVTEPRHLRLQGLNQELSSRDSNANGIRSTMRTTGDEDDNNINNIILDSGRFYIDEHDSSCDSFA